MCRFTESIKHDITPKYWAETTSIHHRLTPTEPRATSPTESDRVPTEYRVLLGHLGGLGQGFLHFHFHPFDAMTSRQAAATVQVIFTHFPLGTKGIATRSKDAPSSSWPYY